MGIGKLIRKGDKVQLLRDLNAIPAGVYRCTGTTAETYEFSIGRKIMFFISKDGQSLMKKVSRKSDCTSRDRFVERYFRLLESLSRKPETEQDPNGPLTFAFIDPSIDPPHSDQRMN